MSIPQQTDALDQAPSTAGCRVPYRVFTDRQYYDREQENIFKGNCWSFVGLEAEVPQAGDFKSTFVGETPVILTRDSDGSLHVVVNVSKDPSLSSDASDIGFTSSALSATARRDFIQIEEEHIKKLDVNAIHGMSSYDQDSFYLWIHE